MTRRDMAVRILVTILVAGLTTLGVLAAVLYGRFQIRPHMLEKTYTMEDAQIVGPGSQKENGEPVKGFVLTEEETGKRYLVTDYYRPIYLDDSKSY